MAKRASLTFHEITIYLSPLIILSKNLSVMFYIFSRNKESCGGSRQKSREHICGRPLGLEFHHETGDLYVADAYLGLLAISSDGTHTRIVATSADGVPFKFTNGLDIDQESGIIYFTDSSTRFRRRWALLHDKPSAFSLI